MTTEVTTPSLIPTLPGSAYVEEAVFRAGVEEVAILRILLDHIDVAGRQVARYRVPRLTEIARDEDIRMVIVDAVRIERNVCGAAVEV